MASPYVYLPLVCPLVHMAAGESRVECRRVNKIAIQGTPQMAVDKEAISISTHTFLSVSCPYFMCSVRARD